ncbi:MAG TPA: hypothetical protein VH475_00985 [Tepidisphaeraceae bacterium]|jgi:hypothetical protein
MLTLYSGKRHNRDLFAWLVRKATGTSNPCRGTVDAKTGQVRFHYRGRPRPAPMVGCALARRCCANQNNTM